MDYRFEDALRLVKEHELSDLVFHKKYSDDEKLQTAFLDGYAIGVLSNLLMNFLQTKENKFKVDREALMRALSGDKEAISEIEQELKNKKV